MLAQTKSNLGPRAPSLNYRLMPVPVEGAGTQVTVQWGQESIHEADELLSRAPRQGRSEDRQECAEWLRKRLAADVAVAWTVVLEEAKAQGWSESILKRAADDIGVVKVRESQVRGGTLWSLKLLL